MLDQTITDELRHSSEENMKLGRYTRNGETFVGAVNERGDIVKLGYGGDTIAALKDIANLKTAVTQAAVVLPSSECTVGSRLPTPSSRTQALRV